MVAVVGVHEPDRVGVCADDQNPTAESTLIAEAIENCPSHAALGEQRRRHRERHEHDPQARELGVLDSGGDDEHVAHAHRDRLQQIPGLFARASVGTVFVEIVEPGADRERREADQGEDELISYGKAGNRRQDLLEEDRHQKSHAECREIGDREPSLQRERPGADGEIGAKRPRVVSWSGLVRAVGRSPGSRSSGIVDHLDGVVPQRFISGVFGISDHQLARLSPLFENCQSSTITVLARVVNSVFRDLLQAPCNLACVQRAEANAEGVIWSVFGEGLPRSISASRSAGIGHGRVECGYRSADPVFRREG